MQKIVITGANGLLGQKLVTLLSQQKQVQLIATGKGPNRNQQQENYQYFSLDVTSKTEVDALLLSQKPHTVIHTAAMTNVDQCESEKELCWAMNVDACTYLAVACSQINAHLVQLSTDFIFDGTTGPYTETAQPNPISYYGHSKLAAEKAIMASSCPWTIARTILVFGIVNDMSRSNIILWVKNSLEAGKTINVVSDQFRSPTLAEDLAMGCWLIAQQKAEGIFNISGKEVLTPYQMAIKTAQYFNLDQSLIQEANCSTFSQPAARPPRTGFIIEKAQKQLGYAPHSFDEGISIVAQQVAAIQQAAK
jgi:dTDP-4-dehydrorhamnose reductase